MMEQETNYWIIAASKDHVNAGVEAGIAQANHGKEAPLKRLKKGDFVIYYSGKQTMGKPEKCQEFTALGKVADDKIFQVQISEDFHPFRRRIEFSQCEDASIIPLIADLDFIQNKKSWGFPFRMGFFRISQHDFDLISSKMLPANDAPES